MSSLRIHSLTMARQYSLLCSRAICVAGSWELVWPSDGDPSPCSIQESLAGCADAHAALEAGSATQRSAAQPRSALQPAAFLLCRPDVPPLRAHRHQIFSCSSFTLSGQAYADTTTNHSGCSDPLLAYLRTVRPACYANSPSACYAELPDLVHRISRNMISTRPRRRSCGGSGQTLCEIPVQAGQVIAAIVTFSFSSPSGDGQSATPALARPHPILRAPASTKPPASTPVTH